MALKQNGGIFGRNPTFNNVTVEGQLNSSGSFVSTGSGTFSSLDVTFGGVKTSSNSAVGFQLGGDSSGSTSIGNIINNTGRFVIEPASTRSFAVRTGAVKADSLVIDHNNHVKVSTGNLVIGTSGKGIDFSATSGTGTSELFDDYEEGTFTPTIIGTTTAGSGTYTLNAGHYTKVGNRVMYNIWLQWTAHTGTGNMNIDGLPYAVNAADAAPANIYVGGAVSLTAGNILGGYAAFGTSQIYLRQLPTGGGAGAAVPLDTSAQLFISGQYRV